MAAGAATVAYATEDSYGSLGGTPTWKQPGTNIEVDGPTLDNQLNREPGQQPDTPKTGRSAEGNVEGNCQISFTMTDENWHELVFPASSNTELYDSGANEWPSATWYISANTPDVQTDRFCQGGCVTDASIQYTQGGEIRVSLTIQYQDEDKSLTAPSAISAPSESDVFMWHGLDPQRSGASIPETQSFEISLSNLCNGRRDQSRYFTRFVPARYELGMTVDAIYQETSHLELAYGSSTQDTTQDTIDQTAFTAAFVNGNGATHTYTLSGGQPTNYNWSELVGEEDLTESIEFHIADCSVTVS